MPVEAVAAWGALSSLTSLEVDTISYAAPAVEQLPNLAELSVTCSIYVDHSLVMLLPALPRLQVLRLPADVLVRPRYSFKKQELDVLGSLHQIRQVDDSCIDAADLTHPFVMSKCFPSMEIMIGKGDKWKDGAEWIKRGEGKEVTKLAICSRAGEGGMKPSISHWSGFHALRSLELIYLDLNSGLRQLRGLTQLTDLKMDNCTPDIHGLDQLPPNLSTLSLSNLRLNAALHEQQEQQGSSTSTPQLPHLTRLVLKGNHAVTSVVTGLIKLQQLVLSCNVDAFIPDALFDSLSQLTCLSSLTIPSLGASNLVLENIAVLAKLPELRQLRVSRRLSPLHGLEIAATLGHLPELKVYIDRHGDSLDGIVSGDFLQVGVIRHNVRIGPCEEAICNFLRYKIWAMWFIAYWMLRVLSCQWRVEHRH
jgi:hypothetical protein